MSWPFTRREITAETLMAERTAGRTLLSKVDREKALRHSAVWACLRLRADLISTMPVDVYKRMNGVQVEQPKPPVMVAPDGARMRWDEFVYATQVDLDSTGNTVGIITAVNSLGKPDRIELVNINDVTFKGSGNRITQYRVGKKEYEPAQIWHERQFVLAGVPVGLSPIAYAALSLQAGISAKEFAASWFMNSTVPSGHLRNTAKVLKREEALRVKDSFKTAVQGGDIWVSGNDWEFNLVAAKASESQFLETQTATAADICRYLGVPGDMIDVETATGSITYANVTQRNLQLLILNLGPAIVRREAAFSVDMLIADRYAKFNTNSLLRMDLKARYDSYKIGIDTGFLDEDEAREFENLAPLDLPNEKKVLKGSEALGALVRAGFDPASAAQALGLNPIKHTGLVPITVATPEPVTKERDEQHFHMDLPPMTMNVHTPEIDLPDVVVNQAPVTVDNHVHVPRAAAPEVRVEAAAPSPAPEVHVHVPEQTAAEVNVNVTNDVQPADVTVLPSEPKTRTIERDHMGNIVKVHEEPS